MQLGSFSIGHVVDAFAGAIGQALSSGFGVAVVVLGSVAAWHWLLRLSLGSPPVRRGRFKRRRSRRFPRRAYSGGRRRRYSRGSYGRRPRRRSYASYGRNRCGGRCSGLSRVRGF
jgi:hypothetical protein